MKMGQNWKIADEYINLYGQILIPVILFFIILYFSIKFFKSRNKKAKKNSKVKAKPNKT